MTQQTTTEAAVRAAIEAEGWFVGSHENALIEATWRRALGSRAWSSTVFRSAKPVYSAEAIPFPASHLDVLVFGTIGRMAFRSGRHQAARYAEAIYRNRHDDLVLAYAVEDLR